MSPLIYFRVSAVWDAVTRGTGSQGLGFASSLSQYKLSMTED